MPSPWMRRAPCSSSKVTQGGREGALTAPPLPMPLPVCLVAEECRKPLPRRLLGGVWAGGPGRPVQMVPREALWVPPEARLPSRKPP